MLSRKRSPVEMCGASSRSDNRAACVPLPAPGGPTRTILMSTPLRRDRRRSRAPILPCGAVPGLPASGRGCPSAQEALVVALHQLALDLLHGVEADADHDQDSSAPEGEVLLALTAGEAQEEVREDRDDAEVDRSGQGDPREDVLEV